MESSGGPDPSRLRHSELLLPQLPGIRRGKGWHSSRNPLAREYDPALRRSLVKFPRRPAGRSPESLPMRSPFSRLYDSFTRADSRSFGRVSTRVFLGGSASASLCSHRKSSELPHLPPSLTMAREHLRSAFLSCSLFLFSGDRHMRSSSACTRRWLRFLPIRSGGIYLPISSSLGSTCISPRDSFSSRVPSNGAEYSIGMAPVATATPAGRLPRRPVRSK